MRELVLMLPTNDSNVSTFDMRQCKLIVRLNPHGLSSLFIINKEGWAIWKANSEEKHWDNALVLVGKFLADNPQIKG